MKWWGWGVEGTAFNPDDKPKLQPFVLERVGLDISATAKSPAPAFEDLDVPASRLPDELRDTLQGIVGPDFLFTDDMDRVVHTFGKSVRDLVRIRRGDFKRVPDVVVYPGTEAEVAEIVDAAVAADAVVIPFGGGSNIVGSLEPLATETRPVISLDLGRMSKVLEIDAEAGLARIQAGALGPSIEEQLGRRGWTMGHFPDSFTHSTLGGWVATRSSGMQSDKYGDIADITRGLRMVMPGQILELRPLPSYSSGPSVREMVIGSEGRLGVITEVWVHIHRVPEERVILAYFFPDMASGLRAMHDIAKSDAAPSVTRVSDSRETQFSMATQKKSKGLSKYVTKGLMEVLKRRGWNLEQMCMSFIGYEGSKAHVAYEKSLVKEIVAKHGGFLVGKGPGQLYDQKKFDTPYIRDFLLDRGAVADVSETAAPWSRLEELYESTIEAAEQAMERVGVRGYIMCHLSHSYHAGACLYFTFAIADDSPESLLKYDEVKRSVQQSFIDNGATISHHHGVGLEHAPWIEADISTAGTFITGKLFEGVDPGNNLNPGKIIHDGKPGITSNSSDA
ncbi:MAG: FAD-binding oxidoreductase [Propionibacterium sp.]|nr:FAD-binding oxidoreductase [Propionibacterium sp.]